MSEDRTLMIFVEKRTFYVDEGRDLKIWLEPRVLDVQDEERVLEVWLP